MGSDKNGCLDLGDIYYFDNNSTTLIYDDETKEEMIKWLSCGNPSNTLHKLGRMSHNKIESCRSIVAKKFKVVPEEIYFTSGATESNNIICQGVIKNCLDKNPKKSFSVITTAFEHSSVINIFKHYENEFKRLEVIYVNPCKDKDDSDYGVIKLKDVEEAIKNAKNKVVLISIMHANNETGAIQNINEIGKVAHKNNIFLHSDMTQSAGKFDIDPYKLNVDSFSFSGHKFHGPKGVGCLFIRKDIDKCKCLCYGGEQESHFRPGTENLANIAGITTALMKVHENRIEKNEKMHKLKQKIINGLSNNLDFMVLGPTDSNKVLPNTILGLFKDIDSDNRKIVEEMDKRNIFVSVGSACQTESKTGSHVLESMDIDFDDRNKVIRISLSDYNTNEEADYLIENLTEIIKNQK